MNWNPARYLRKQPPSSPAHSQTFRGKCTFSSCHQLDKRSLQRHTLLAVEPILQNLEELVTGTDLFEVMRCNLERIYKKADLKMRVKTGLNLNNFNL